MLLRQEREMRFRWMGLAVASVLFAMMPSAAMHGQDRAKGAQRPPNLVIVFADDLAQRDALVAQLHGLERQRLAADGPATDIVAIGP